MSDLEPIQQSRLGEIGQLLNQARQEKGMTLEEVSGKTLIRATILKAIEEGDARPLPEPVYIRGFIRRFGDLVGLNGTELCDSFPWQPSGSVPLSFVTAGNVAVAKKPAQESSAAASPAVEQREPQEVSAESTTGLVSGDVATAVVAEQSEPELGSENNPLDVSVDGGAEPASGLPEPVAITESVISEEPLAAASNDVVTTESADLTAAAVEENAGSRPDHDAAYESRAALFGVADADGIAGEDDAPAMSRGEAASSEAPIAAAEKVVSAAPDDGRAPESSTAGAGVATLPPPPAPVFYREPEQRSPLPWILAAVAALLGLGIAVLAFGNRPTAPTVAGDPDAVEQVEPSSEGSTAPEGDATEAATPAETTPPSAAVASDKVVLELEVKGTEDAWMDVLVDGELQIEGNQVPGFKQRWEGDQEIELATARPDMVWISVNGSKAQPFGKLAEANPVKVGGFKPANAQ